MVKRLFSLKFPLSYRENFCKKGPPHSENIFEGFSMGRGGGLPPTLSVPGLPTLTHILLTCYSRTHAIDKFTNAFKKDHTHTHAI